MKKEQLFGKKNVIGHCETRDKVFVFVTKKVPLEQLALEHIVPEMIKTSLFNSKKSDVVELGDIQAQVDGNVYKPLKGGCEISPQGSNWVGTLGGKVYRRYVKNKIVNTILVNIDGIMKKVRLESFTKERAYGLTNCHVTQDNVIDVTPNIIITQPFKGRVIGRAVKHSVMEKKKKNTVDAALIELSEDMLEEQIQIGPTNGTAEGVIGEGYRMYGRTTGYAEGKLQYANATIAVNYGENLNLTFKGCYIFERLSLPGNSGGTIISKDNKTVALLFAGSDTVSIAIPIQTVLDEMGVFIK